ncbi:unnamed protein product [Rotaria sordida]|uniref:Uncharacterized protein n=1 Tax=Rotaria sordida TaxID=392033 RepID=A0A813YKM5_9BILA|nr:unnamed protein product [Rotaria sordida]CAF0935999.1 unnamed protein product [Rotaria sordida]
MTWFNNRTHIGWSLRQCFLVLTSVIIFISLIIAALVIFSRISINLSNHAVHIKPSTVAFSFSVTYVLVDESIRSSTEFNLNSIDRVKLARNFEYALDLGIQNILTIHNISPITVIEKRSKSRHRRFVQCKQDPNKIKGSVLIFDFNLTCPIDHICQNEKCINETIDKIYKHFQSVPSLSIDFKNVSRELRLCSIDVLSRTIRKLPQVSTTSISTIPYRHNSTTVYSSTEESNLNTSASTMTKTIMTNESSNSTLNQTIDFSLTEQVPPCRIFHTSTLFFQDDHTLIVIGASKFETIIDMQRIKKRIIINGVMVHENCQRTLDISTPIVCYPSTAS